MPYKGRIGDVVESGRCDGDIFSFEWKIPDFLSLACEGGDIYESPFFNAFDGSWFFFIYPKGMSQTSNWVSLRLFRVDSGPPKSLSITLGIRGPEGVENKKEIGQEFSDDDDACCWYEFCRRSKLKEQNSRLMPGNILTLTLHMKSVMLSVAREASTQTDEGCKEAAVPTDETESSEKQGVDALLRSEQNALKSAEGCEVTLKEQGLEELQKSLKSVLRSGDDCDVIIKVRGKEFRAHRLILRARSPVFQAMFSHDMVEKQSGTVNMEDCDPETFPQFLEHIYTGSVEMISTANVFSLYAVSEKYDLATLKRACADFIKKKPVHRLLL